MAVVFFILVGLIVTGLVLFGANGFISSLSEIHHKIMTNPIIQNINSHIMKNPPVGNQTVSKIAKLKGNT